MGEVIGAVIATALVLAAVFVPVAFFPGTTGRLYQQFALTIAFSMAISAFNALTLTPALSALLLDADEHARARSSASSTGSSTAGRGSSSPCCAACLRCALGGRRSCSWSGSASTYWVYRTVPTGVRARRGPGLRHHPSSRRRRVRRSTTRDRSRSRSRRASARSPRSTALFAVVGFSFGGAAPNQGLIFVNLKPFEERSGESTRRRRSWGGCSAALQHPRRHGIPFLPPSIQGSSQFGGFSFQVLDQSGGDDRRASAQATQAAGRQGNQTPGLRGLFTSSRRTIRSCWSTIDREKAKSLGLSLGDITSTLQVLLGSEYVNDFDFNNRSYRVYVQADQQFRANPQELRRSTCGRAAAR